MKTQITLQDIADRAGVSRTTVSMALRNLANLPLSTRRRIREMADALGYRPNPLVATLMSYQRAAKSERPKHLTLALILRFSRDADWPEYFSPDLLAGAMQRAVQLGYNLEQFWIGDLKMDGVRLSQMLSERAVPGLLIAPLSTPAGHLRLDWESFSTVAIGDSVVRPELHRVTSSPYKAMLLAVHELRRRGYRRMGLALEASQDARVRHQWGASFSWNQARRHPQDRVPPLVVDGTDWSERRFAAWFRRHQPEVILADDGRVLAWLGRLGLSVPQDVGFVHLWNRDTSGKCAGLYHDPPALGAAAIDLLVSLIQANDRGVPARPKVVQLEAHWVNGQTIKTRTRSRPGRSIPSRPISALAYAPIPAALVMNGSAV